METKCPNCGAPMEGNTCKYCGYENKTADTGANNESQGSVAPQIIINTANTTNPQNNIGAKSKVTALVLCIFLGPLGIHRFYTGKIGTGIIWLLSGGVCGIGWIVDIITIATGSFTDSFGLRLK